MEILITVDIFQYFSAKRKFTVNIDFQNSVN